MSDFRSPKSSQTPKEKCGECRTSTNKYTRIRAQICRGGKGRMRFPTIGLILLVALIVGAFFLTRPMLLEGAPSSHRIKIPRHATLQNVSDSLHKYYPADYADHVVRLLKARDVDFADRYGSYVINEGTSPFNAMRRLSSGGETPVKITFNNLRTPEDLAEVISRKTDFSRSDFLKALSDSDLLSHYNVDPQDGMALMMEDTYEVYWSSSPAEVIETIAKNYKKYWSDSRIAKAKSLGLTPVQMMTLASIVDEESNIQDEKGHIGQLYIRRMAKGMRLQSDPTVKYAVGDFTIKRITDRHLNTQSPYNTYRVAGLPPTPIRTTNTKTLNAILEAPTTQDIYMCAKEDFSGRHNFSSDYDEHLRNARRYQDELNRRGIH